MSEIKVGSIVTVPGWKQYAIVVQKERNGDEFQVCNVDSMSWVWIDPKLLTLVLPPLLDHAPPAAPVVDDAEYQRERRQLWSRIAALAFADDYKAEACADHADKVLAEFDKRFGRKGGGDA